ncbi:hypothetical protein Tcan_08207 [Toxocara canis]|uniref:EGF-like domain-containing protein n=1 Tax=Toxocara canis TaxID=6265 RepID=A0A0B2VLB7_TOXCA|nr:hypothetical protein Tcan_08207 [Toxocara canis]
MVFDSVHRIQLRKGDANDERAKIVELDNGESLSIECTADDSYSPSSFMFLHNERRDNFKQTEVEIDERRTLIKIANFVANIHEGEYLCAASSSTGPVERTIVVKKRNRLNDLHYAMRCKENRCRNGGQCFVPLSGDRTPFCLCPNEYAGRDCDSHSVSSYAIQGTKATFGVGGLCTSALIVFCILFAVLYRREKRNRRETENKLEDLVRSYVNDKEHQKVGAGTNLIGSGYIDELSKPECTAVLNFSSYAPPHARAESCDEFEVNVDDQEPSKNEQPARNFHVPRGRLDATSDSVVLLDGTPKWQ